jgi:ABC-type glycerol-3-phosphate transport system permease component
MISILAEFVHDWASAGVRRGVELLSATAGAIFILHRRTFYRTVRTKDTAVAWLRTQQRLTINAFISARGIAWRELAAAACVMLLPGLAFGIVARHFLVSGLTHGAVK